MNYLIDIAQLSDTVAATPVQPKHAALLGRLRAFDSLNSVKFCTSRGNIYLQRRKVLTASGELVHADHEAWLKTEYEREPGGDVRALQRRLRQLDYRLTECEITILYLIHDRGGALDDFVQVVVKVEDEFIDRRLFPSEDWWGEAQDFRDLCFAAESGARFQGDQRRRYRNSSYRFVEAIDFAAFMREANELNSARDARLRNRIVKVTDLGDGESRRMRIGDFDPQANQFAWKGQRMFDDWRFCSAGRSGARICDHWVFETSDYTSKDGVHSLSFIPAWTYPRKLAEIKRAPKSDYELFGKLESMDARLNVSFGWYFYMLHGNRIPDWVGERVLHAAEAGKIVLPEHDYRVLKTWVARPYGF